MGGNIVTRSPPEFPEGYSDISAITNDVDESGFRKHLPDRGYIVKVQRGFVAPSFFVEPAAVEEEKGANSVAKIFNGGFLQSFFQRIRIHPPVTPSWVLEECIEKGRSEFLPLKRKQCSDGREQVGLCRNCELRMCIQHQAQQCCAGPWNSYYEWYWCCGSAHWMNVYPLFNL